jgi:hypothetical protein
VTKIGRKVNSPNRKPAKFINMMLSEVVCPALPRGTKINSSLRW